jgi:DNA-binding IclR family transcriptional regulator
VDVQPKDKRYFLETLARGLAFLEMFVEETGGLTVTEAARRMGGDLTSAYRMVRTLEELDYLREDGVTKRYKLGTKILAFGIRQLESLELRDVAMPHLRDLAEETGETVSLAVLGGGQAVVIERIESKQRVVIRGHVGWTFPLHTTSLGKALLAFEPESDVPDVLERNRAATGVRMKRAELAALNKELRTIRKNGYALNDEQSAAGLRAVAAPIRDFRGEVVASVNVGGPTMRINLKDLRSRLAGAVVETAAKISADLGYRLS